MKILVLSDSHAGLAFMRLCISKVKPDCVVHLGDYFDDGMAMAEENPHIRFYQVQGNCDRFRCDPGFPQILCCDIGGVRFYMTHGHLHGVKTCIGNLLAEARRNAAQVVLYGHTHSRECFCEDGLWVMNPGSCGSYGGSAGVVEIREREIFACRLLQQAELESM